MQLLPINKKKGFGLVEIIIAIAIFGTAMIATIAIAIASLRTVKDNELADSANAVMIGSLEYMKSPVNVPVLTALPSSRTTYAFEITSDIDPENCRSGECNYTIAKTNNTTEITECSSNSIYRVTITSAPDFLVCNQILVTKKSNEIFEIKSIIIFFSSKNGLEKNQLIGYRNVAS